MAKPKTEWGQFDEVKLRELSEPISISIDKLYGGRPMPVAVPVKPAEQIAGEGWSHDDVKILGEWISSTLGGGHYRCTATGANGSQHRWEIYFPTDKFPEKLPPGAPAVAPPQPQLAGPTQIYAPPGVPNWMAAAAPPPTPPSYLPPQPYNGGAPTTYGGYLQGQGYGQPLAVPGVERERDREALIKLESKIERERLENGYREQMTGLQGEFRRTQEMLAQMAAKQATAAAAPPPQDAQVRELQARLDRQEEQHRMEARLAESDRRHAESLAAVQQGMNAQMQALTQSMQALVSQISAKPAGPDPTIMLLLESQKQQAEAQRETARLMADAQKETARLQADAQREAARTALGPRELIELMTRQSGNQEHIIQASRAAIDIMKESVDAALNMRGGDAHPALAMVQEGLTNTMQLAQHYISSKSQTEAVKANSAAVQAQAVAQTAQANAFAASQRPPAINGASPVVPAIEPPSAEPEEEEDDDETETKPGPGLKLTPEETEQQLFGPALEAVQRLRIGVKTKIIIPSQASAAVLQGISHFARLGQRVPAFDLVRAREYGKLVDILLPDSDLAFKEQMIDGLVPALEQMANNGTPPPAGAQVATGAAA